MQDFQYLTFFSGIEETANMIKRCGGKAYAFKCDVSNREEVYEVAEKTRNVVGKVDILLNNAGALSMIPYLLLVSSRSSSRPNALAEQIAYIWTYQVRFPGQIRYNSKMGVLESFLFAVSISTEHIDGACQGCGWRLQLTTIVNAVQQVSEVLQQ